MSTAAQVLASQTNGALSHGPVTPEGRAISSRNALKHGLTSATVVLADESQQAYDELLASFAALYCPRTEVEHLLVGHLAAAQWRLARCARFETLLLNAEIEKLQNEPDNPRSPALAAAEAFRILMEKGGALAQLLRHESSLWRAYERARKQLHVLAQMPAPPAPVLQNEPEPSRPDPRPPKPKGKRQLPKLPRFSAIPKLPSNMRLIALPPQPNATAPAAPPAT